MPIVDPEANTEVVLQRRRAKNPFPEKERKKPKKLSTPATSGGGF